MLNFLKDYSGVLALVIVIVMSVFQLTRPVEVKSTFGSVDPAAYTTFTSLNVATSNSATSTTAVGCVQTVATSTATAIRLVYSSIATSSATYSGTNTIGLVGWQYGNCPN